MVQLILGKKGKGKTKIILVCSVFEKYTIR